MCFVCTKVHFRFLTPHLHEKRKRKRLVKIEISFHIQSISGGLNKEGTNLLVQELQKMKINEPDGTNTHVVYKFIIGIADIIYYCASGFDTNRADWLS